MDEIDKAQQAQIDRAAEQNDAQERKLWRGFVALALLFAWLGVLTLASIVAPLIQNKVTITIEPRK